MAERAWTLGYAPSYELAVRMPGNMKAPAGIVFGTPKEALAWAQDPARRDETYPESQGSRPWDWKPYEIELPNGWFSDTSTNREKVWRAFHEWHSWQDNGAFDTRCGICMEDDYRGQLGHLALLVPAALINPDTGQPA